MGGLAVIIATSGVAYGAIPSSDGSVKSCYAKTDGLLLGIPHSKGDVRIVDSGEACRAYEQQISLASAAQIDALTARVQTLEQSSLDSAAQISTLNGRVQALEQSTLSSRVQALESTLSKVSYSDTGLNGLPTLKINGANLQIVNGTGTTYPCDVPCPNNGLGNLFLGYDDHQIGKGGTLTDQSGSHNLVIGDHHTVTSSGGLVAGVFNRITGTGASVSGGMGNTASGEFASILGGGNHEEASDLGFFPPAP
jgi:hypothetical protein